MGQGPFSGGVTLGAADGVCASAATAAHLPGAYVAWLSDSSTDAITRVKNANGWIRTDGAPFAETSADLIAPRLGGGLRFDEFGNDLWNGGSYLSVLTNTTGQGVRASAQLCQDSKSLVGFAWNPFAGWTESAVGGCDQFRLYCFEIDGDAPVTLPVRDRYAFVTDVIFDPVTGPSKPDDLCQNQVYTHNLFGGSFWALVAESATSPAIQRFDLSGPPWMTLDGTEIAPTTDNLANGRLLHPINIDPSGYIVDHPVATGGLPIALPTAAATCSDWSSQSSTFTLGNSRIVDFAFNNGETVPCNGAAVALYCLER